MIVPRLKDPETSRKALNNQGVNPTTDGFHLTPSSVARVKSQTLLTRERKTTKTVLQVTQGERLVTVNLIGFCM